MDFTFSAEQDELRRTLRSFLADRAPRTYVAAMEDDAIGVTAEVWARIVDMGLTALLVPESCGGAGAGLLDAVVVMEEMGRVPFPGPYFSSAVTATIAARRLGLDDLMVSLAAGATRGTVALEEQGGDDPVNRVRTRATRKAGRWRLSGLKPVVLDGHSADWALVVARTEHGLGTFLLEAPRGELVPALDVGRKVARLALDGGELEPVGPPGDQSPIWRRVIDDVNVAACAELVGAMQGANDLAVQYAKDRVQFGRPIATFQVIKHKAADMLHRLELARVGTHYAAWASDADDAAREESAAMAKAYVAEAAVFVTGECIQIHGGVGFTWDCDAHRWYRKAKQTDLLLGYQGFQRGRLADLVLDRC